MTTGPIQAQSTDRYTPVARIGSGGQAEILLAVHRGSGGFEKLVVIKRLLPHLAGDERSRRRLTQEAQLVAQLHHPNVCQVLNLIENDAGPLLVLEYLDGITVAQIGEMLPAVRSRDEIRLIAGVLQQASEGLHSAHSLRDRSGAPAGLVHRDVSSANLIVTREGVVKVLDFGIAKAASSDESRVQTIRGTVPFMSPEQVEGRELDPRSDVFSLAVVAWETLTGLGLYRRANLDAIFAAILTEEAPPIGDHQPALPARFEEVVRRALTKDRDRRPASAREFGAAVAEAVREIGGPMGLSEIASVVETRFAEGLTARSRQFEMMRMGRTETVEAHASRWTPETFFSLPQLDLSAAFHSTMSLEPEAQGPAALTDPTVPNQRRSPPDASDAAAPAAAAGSEPPGAGPWFDYQPLAARPRRGPWLLLALGALVVAGLATTALISLDAEEQSAKAEPVATAAAVLDAASAAAPEPAAVTPDAGVVTPDAAPPVADATPPPAGSRAIERKPSGPSRKRPRPAAVLPGFLTIDSRPAAQISIDGRAMGQVPLYRVELAPGRHQVQATVADGRSKTLTIVIRSGQDLRKRLEW